MFIGILFALIVFPNLWGCTGLAASKIAAADGTATPAIFCAVIGASALLEAFLDPSPSTIGLWVGSEFLALATAKPREAVVGLEAPMARAWENAASLLAFSLIACCFPSSFARIGMRSSGIGLFSCQPHKLCCIDDELETYLEIFTKLDWFCQAFIHVALDRC